MRRSPIAALAALAALALLSRRFHPVRAAGDSMSPSIEPGDLLAVRGLHPDEPRRGQVVLARSGELEIVKRVVAVPGDRGLGRDEYWLEGDRPERSTDSRMFGSVPRERIVAVVSACYWPPARARWFGAATG